MIKPGGATSPQPEMAGSDSGYGLVMEQRILRSNRPCGIGGRSRTWQLGGDWGEVGDDDAMAVLVAAAESGVTLFDTADVYGDGRSEQLIGRFLSRHPGAGVLVATKMGRRVEQLPQNYVLANFQQVERSLPAQPRRRPARPRPVALPADRGLQP